MRPKWLVYLTAVANVVIVIGVCVLWGYNRSLAWWASSSLFLVILVSLWITAVAIDWKEDE